MKRIQIILLMIGLLLLDVLSAAKPARKRDRDAEVVVSDSDDERESLAFLERKLAVARAEHKKISETKEEDRVAGLSATDLTMIYDEPLRKTQAKIDRLTRVIAAKDVAARRVAPVPAASAAAAPARHMSPVPAAAAAAEAEAPAIKCLEQEIIFFPGSCHARVDDALFKRFGADATRFEISFLGLKEHYISSLFNGDTVRDAGGRVYYHERELVGWCCRGSGSAQKFLHMMRYADDAYLVRGFLSLTATTIFFRDLASNGAMIVALLESKKDAGEEITKEEEALILGAKRGSEFVDKLLNCIGLVYENVPERETALFQKLATIDQVLTDEELNGLIIYVKSRMHEAIEQARRLMREYGMNMTMF